MRDLVFHISIPNWAKHNPRSDRGGFSWSKLDNQFHLHMRQRRGYSAVATNLMVLLFQESSRADGQTFAFRVKFAVDMLGYSAKAIGEALKELATGHDASGGEIVLQESSRSLKPLSNSSSLDTTDTTDTTQQTQLPKPAPLDFDSLYRKYPRKDGKSKGMATCRAQIKTPEDFAALSLAIDRYGEHIRHHGTEAKYIKHFSTFMHSWRDWLEADTGTAVNAQGFDWNKVFGEDKDAG